MMQLTMPVFEKTTVNHTISEPTLNKALFGSRYWLITLIISIALHFLVMHGLPWLNQINLEPAGMQSITASFKVLPNPVQATTEALPEILPVLETPPIQKQAEPVKKEPTKAEQPKLEPVLQSTDVAQTKEFAIAKQTPDLITKAKPEPTIETTESIPETKPINASSSQTTQAAPSTNANSNPTTTSTTQNQSTRNSHDNGLLDAYGRDLQRLCERNKQYPAIAIRRNLEGAGSVQVTFNKDGIVQSITIEQSTGQQSLDDQAMKMVQKSLASLPLPSQLRGQILTLSVPISFKLDG